MPSPLPNARCKSCRRPVVQALLLEGPDAVELEPVEVLDVRTNYGILFALPTVRTAWQIHVCDSPAGLMSAASGEAG